MIVLVLSRGRDCFSPQEATSKPARPSRSGFSFALAEHRRHDRVALAAMEVGSTNRPRAEPPVASWQEEQQLAPAP